ncbi:PREDICTED: uncharacterized protein LOC105570988 [Vollenhovia emeryi]|uniref:uncharacterized protein LOC105570988 n=1 Tax=Vollenhovia emeryi TaxID=411798 RepID=UPI0005F46C0B|nr:PREDICTED: uncharacterized protein LOC105570988 [Vollenhovia emeryi]
MANKLDSGFVKADARNIPTIDMFMICEFIKNSDDFNSVEIRNKKLATSSRENYGDQAIGYVCLKRDGPICTVKCRVCPEHRVREKGYAVTLTIDEDNDKIIDVQCHNCAAANGKFD